MAKGCRGVDMEALILLLGAGIPALLLCLASHPTRDETDNEWMDRIFSPSFDGDSRRKRVPEYGYSKRRKPAAKRRKPARR